MKHTHPILSLFLFTCVVAGCFNAEERPTKLHTIARWQDQRLAPVDSIRSLLNDRDAHVRLAAVRAAGLIGRTEIAPQVAAALTDPSLTVRAEAAWALGLIGDPASLVYLTAAAKETPPQLRHAAVAALAHLSNDGTALLAAARHPDPKTAALAWNGLRNQAAHLAPDSLRSAIVTGLRHPATTVRWRVLRCAEMVTDSTLVPVLAPFATSGQAQVAVHAYRALSHQKGADALAAVLNGLSTGQHFNGRERIRVRIAATHAIGTLGHYALHDPTQAERLVRVLISSTQMSSPHLTETALLAMSELVAEDKLPPEAADQESLLPVWRLRLVSTARSQLTTTHVGVRAAALTALAALRGGGAAREITAALGNEKSPQVIASALTALAMCHDNPVPIILPYLRQTTTHPLIRTAALTALSEIRLRRAHITATPAVERKLTAALLTATTGSDFVVNATAAELLGSLPTNESILALIALWDRADGPGRFEIRRGVLSGMASLLTPVAADADAQWHRDPTLVKELQRMLRESFDSSDIRIRLDGRAAAQANGLLSAQLVPSVGSLRATLPAVHRAAEQPAVTTPFDAPAIHCISDRGSFTIALDGRLAPNTCRLFLALIKADYFHDLTFHRVVPDFVVQGGDPRGDGWGGPGFSIRSEWSRTDFKRGVVGIATDGKDTGGSQFFITLSPQPHLNGRYTVIGRITAGMEIVDRLEIGDNFSLTMSE